MESLHHGISCFSLQICRNPSIFRYSFVLISPHLLFVDIETDCFVDCAKYNQVDLHLGGAGAGCVGTGLWIQPQHHVGRHARDLSPSTLQQMAAVNVHCAGNLFHQISMSTGATFFFANSMT